MFASDQAWIPPVGVLFVRILLAPWEHVVEFGYVHEQKPITTSFHYYTLARIRNWRAEPLFGGMLDCGVGETGKTDAGGAIVRRVADRDDVDALRKLWGDRRMTFAEWCEDACSRPELGDASKAMLRKQEKK